MSYPVGTSHKTIAHALSAASCAQHVSATHDEYVVGLDST